MLPLWKIISWIEIAVAFLNFPHGILSCQGLAVSLWHIRSNLGNSGKKLHFFSSAEELSSIKHKIITAASPQTSYNVQLWGTYEMLGYSQKSSLYYMLIVNFLKSNGLYYTIFLPYFFNNVAHASSRIFCFFPFSCFL